jgi:hypothetical protein
MAQKLWDKVLDIQTRIPIDVIELESAMMEYLRHLETEKHHKAAGYSVQYPRFLYVPTSLSPQKEIDHLTTHYWARYKQVQRLDKLIKERRESIQRVCTHVWERDWSDRGHRSHYECKLCGKYR